MKQPLVSAIALVMFAGLVFADELGPRSETVASALQSHLKKNPNEITANDLASITSIKLPHIHLQSFHENDFSGLTNLKRLEFYSLFHRIGKRETLPPPFTNKVFAKLPQLDELVITGDQLGVLPDDVFAGLKSLRILVLTNVTLPHLPKSMLELPKIEQMYYDGKGMPKEEYEFLKKTLGEKLKAKR